MERSDLGGVEERPCSGRVAAAVDRNRTRGDAVTAAERAMFPLRSEGLVLASTARPANGMIARRRYGGRMMEVTMDEEKRQQQGDNGAAQEGVGNAADPMRAPTDGSADPANQPDAPEPAQDEDGKDDKKFLSAAQVAGVAFEAQGALRGAMGEPYNPGTFNALNAIEKSQFTGQVTGDADKPDLGKHPAPSEAAKQKVFEAVVKALKPFMHDDDTAGQ